MDALSGVIDAEVRAVADHPPREWLRHFIDVTETDVRPIALEQEDRTTNSVELSRSSLLAPAARGDAGPESDVDFLVEFEDGRSLLDLSGLWLDLEELLGRKVDVAQPQTLHWYIRDRVLKEAIPL